MPRYSPTTRATCNCAALKEAGRSVRRDQDQHTAPPGLKKDRCDESRLYAPEEWIGSPDRRFACNGGLFSSHEDRGFDSRIVQLYRFLQVRHGLSGSPCEFETPRAIHANVDGFRSGQFAEPLECLPQKRIHVARAGHELAETD